MIPPACGMLVPARFATFDQPSGDHSLARFSPDGTTLFTTSGLNGVVKRWDARTFAPQKSIADRGTGVSDLDFSPDGHRLLTIDFRGEVHLWNLATAEDGITFKVGDWSSTGRFTAGGTRLFTVSEDLKLSDASTGELIASFAAAIRIGFPYRPTAPMSSLRASSANPSSIPCASPITSPPPAHPLRPPRRAETSGGAVPQGTPGAPRSERPLP